MPLCFHECDVRKSHFLFRSGRCDLLTTTVVLKQQCCTIASSRTASTSGLNASAVSSPSSPWGGGGRGSGGIYSNMLAVHNGAPALDVTLSQEIARITPESKGKDEDKRWTLGSPPFHMEKHSWLSPGPHCSATPMTMNLCWKQSVWCDPDGCMQTLQSARFSSENIL